MQKYKVHYQFVEHQSDSLTIEKKTQDAEKQLRQNRENATMTLTKNELEKRQRNGMKKNIRNAHRFNLHVMEIIQPWIAMNYKITFEEMAERLNERFLTRQGKEWNRGVVERVYNEYEDLLTIKKKRKKNC